jgi:hypothetical protein
MDYTIYSGEWPVGRIYEERGSAQDQRWFWSLFGILANPPDMHTNGRAPTQIGASRTKSRYPSHLSATQQSRAYGSHTDQHRKEGARQAQSGRTDTDGHDYNSRCDIGCHLSRKTA